MNLLYEISEMTKTDDNETYTEKLDGKKMYEEILKLRLIFCV